MQNIKARRISIRQYCEELRSQGIIKTEWTIRRWCNERGEEGWPLNGQLHKAEKDPGGRDWLIVIAESRD